MSKTIEESSLEFQSPGTQHINGVIEQVFVTIYSRIYSIMVHVLPYENLKTGIWSECEATTNKLETCMVNTHEYKCE